MVAAVECDSRMRLVAVEVPPSDLEGASCAVCLAKGTTPTSGNSVTITSQCGKLDRLTVPYYFGYKRVIASRWSEWINLRSRDENGRLWCCEK